MRVAFFILMHKNPEQTIRLIERLESPMSTFIVHVDSRAPDKTYKFIDEWAAKRNDVHCAPRHRCYWAGFGIVAASLECARTALRLNERFDYGMLLSGQDYPIKPLGAILEFLTLNRGKQFIETFRLDQSNRWDGQGGAFQPMNRVSWYIVRIRSRRISIPIRRSLPAGLRPCGGSQWWCLSRDSLLYIDDYLTKNPKVLRFFRNVSVPDESLFQTLVYNSPFQPQVLSDDLHYADWERPNPNYPRILDESDLERIRTSNKLFARKFDIARDRRILDLIDEEILFSR